MVEPSQEPAKETVEIERIAGKTLSYAFALILTCLLAFQCWSADRRNQDLPTIPCVLELAIIAGLLGVTIDPAAIGQVLVKK